MYLLGYFFFFMLISWGCLTSLTNFFSMSYFDWPIAKTSWNYGRFPQNRRLKMEGLSLWPTYIGETRRALGKAYEIKGTIGNLTGTHWREHKRNMLGTKEKWKNPFPFPSSRAILLMWVWIVDAPICFLQWWSSNECKVVKIWKMSAVSCMLIYIKLTCTL